MDSGKFAARVAHVDGGAEVRRAVVSCPLMIAASPSLARPTDSVGYVTRPIKRCRRFVFSRSSISFLRAAAGFGRTRHDGLRLLLGNQAFLQKFFYHVRDRGDVLPMILPCATGNWAAAGPESLAANPRE